jgi:hypothetical protein
MLLTLAEVERLTAIRKKLQERAGPGWPAACACEVFLLADVCVALRLSQAQTALILGADGLRYVNENVGRRRP